MFWGVTLDAGKRYTQVVEKSFHLSMAALGFQNSSALPVTVMVEVEKANFALCTLQAGKIPQQPLDYAFTEGEEITFYSEGPGEVHLTGYLTEDMEPIEFDEEELSAASEESTSESAYSQSEEEKSSDEEEEFSEDAEVTLQDLLHGENEDSDDSSSEDEWDPSKNNPGKKRKIKTENKKTRKKKKTSTEDSFDSGVDSNTRIVKSENMNEKQERHDLGVFYEASQNDDDDDSDEDWSPPVEAEEKKKLLTAKEKRLLKKKAKKKLKQREKTAEVNDSENVKIRTSENTPSVEKGTVTNGVTVNSNGTENNSQAAQAEKNTMSPRKSKKPKHSSKELNNSKVVSESSPKKKSPEKSVHSKPSKQERRVIPGGISVEDVVVGQGKMAKNGQKVSLFYRGILAHNKKQFDACLHGRPFSFVLGTGKVIRGWDLGVAGMKVGGKRKLVIPPSQGYGNKKNGLIPPNSTLEFEVQLLKVE